jgi:exodeoxyribonuclease V alpha subunit
VTAGTSSSIGDWEHVLGATPRFAAEVVAAGEHPDVQLGCALAVWAPMHGHACVDLEHVVSQVATELANSGDMGVVWPAAASWRRRLASSRLVRVVESHDSAESLARSEPLDECPMVLYGSLLYTQRQWIDECVVVARVKRLAATSSAMRLIVGGPGTGKTTLIADVVRSWLADGLRVAAVAPTGKAAARLGESFAAAGIAVQATTVHRLLGGSPASSRFWYHDGRRLPVDAVVVDEASMVSLPLLARMLEALADDARLVLVGDPDQLESVEVGSVLADLVRAGETGMLPLTRLTQSHRQAAGSTIPVLAEAIRANRPDQVVDVLGSGDHDISWLTTGAGLDQRLVQSFGPYVASCRAGDADGARANLGAVRVLCAHRHGEWGIGRWNQHIAGLLGVPTSGVSPQPGMALLVTRNDQRQGLANGDTGAVIATTDGVRVALGGRVAGAAPRLFNAAQLDHVEPALATTVHKSQGSEHHTVVVVLPPADSPLATRQLLYTAVTRATTKLIVVGSEAALRACVARPVRRVSGLDRGLQVSSGQLQMVDFLG